MRKMYSSSDLPDGYYWYREKFKRHDTGEMQWLTWEFVVVADVPTRGNKTERLVIGHHWKCRIDTMMKRDRECQFIPIPPPPTDEEINENLRLRQASEAAGPQG